MHTWIQLDSAETAKIVQALKLLGDTQPSIEAEKTASLAQRIEELGQPEPHAEAFADAAAQKISDPDEIDGASFISQSEEGAYVMAWIWVDNEEAGIEPDEEEDGDDEA